MGTTAGGLTGRRWQQDQEAGWAAGKQGRLLAAGNLLRKVGRGGTRGGGRE